ncbi:Os1348 family NHLP clan protein [Vibrio alginolyticus]|uniref:Os1348 family NHLP clan protein n=1 Tax=Vibrio alginolyticus TaxID=663 RepID=UPI00354C17E4
MSQEKLAAIVGKAAVDEDFLKLLKDDVEAVITATSDLTDDEKDALRALDTEELDNLNAATAATHIRAIVNKKDA